MHGGADGSPVAIGHLERRSPLENRAAPDDPPAWEGPSSGRPHVHRGEKHMRVGFRRAQRALVLAAAACGARRPGSARGRSNRASGRGRRTGCLGWRAVLRDLSGRARGLGRHLPQGGEGRRPEVHRAVRVQATVQGRRGPDRRQRRRQARRDRQRRERLSGADLHPRADGDRGSRARDRDQDDGCRPRAGGRVHGRRCEGRRDGHRHRRRPPGSRRRREPGGAALVPELLGSSPASTSSATTTTPTRRAPATSRFRTPTPSRTTATVTGRMSPASSARTARARTAPRASLRA